MITAELLLTTCVDDFEVHPRLGSARRTEGVFVGSDVAGPLPMADVHDGLRGVAREARCNRGQWSRTPNILA